MPEETLPPGSTIGILGGGQLGRMLSVAASRLGLKTYIYNDEPDAPAFDVAAETTVGAYDDPDAIAAFAKSVDVVTCEFENVPAKALEIAGRESHVFPPPKSFEVAQDRLVEKDFISGLGIAVAPYMAVDSLGDLKEALARVRPAALLKTRRFGYDGKGQVMIHTLCEAETAWEKIGAAPSVLEGVIRFEREISVIAVRAQDGETRFYDVVENVHQAGILATSRVPTDISDSAIFEARKIAGRIAEALGHVGVLCVEMFQREAEAPHLIVNEIAPRVHNSGHWTIDACLVSQFENHVRAICGWPLGDVGRHSDAVMTNLIGANVGAWRDLAGEPGTGVHLYGKAEARPGRKMGHVTRVAPKMSD
ncbi:MAG TPA: 5-(carboxyamino)imidazole ribonucleotide synthase [Methyloceanibacter sp.]|nr:5-(carboxyamino)imidazole ribonucleotide synthase [Methyloceanibacter sp.]